MLAFSHISSHIQPFCATQKHKKEIKCPTNEENTQRQAWKNSLEVWKVYEDCKNFTQESLFPKLSSPKYQNVSL